MTMDAEIVDLSVKRDTSSRDYGEGSRSDIAIASCAVAKTLSQTTNGPPSTSFISKGLAHNNIISQRNQELDLRTVTNTRLSPVKKDSHQTELSASLAHHVQAAMDQVLRSVSLAPQTDSPPPTNITPMVGKHKNLPPLIPASVAYVARTLAQANAAPGLPGGHPSYQQAVLSPPNADQIKTMIRSQIENRQGSSNQPPIVHVPSLSPQATLSFSQAQAVMNTDMKLPRSSPLKEPPALIQVTIPVAVNSISAPPTPHPHYPAPIITSPAVKSPDFIFRENNNVMKSSPAVVQALKSLPHMNPSLPVTSPVSEPQLSAALARVQYGDSSPVTNGSPCSTGGELQPQGSPIDRNLQVIKQGSQIILNSNHPIDDNQLEAVRRVLESPTELQDHFGTPQQFVNLASEPISEEAEIEDFMAKYVTDNGNRKEPAVRDLRHIIPLLIAYCFGIKDDPSQKKVKGMWYEPPAGWPADIPYVDPNNTMKGLYGDNLMGKPKKEVLMRMFEFLVRRFYNIRSGTISTDSLLTPGATMLAGKQEDGEDTTKTMISPAADQKTVISSNNNNTIIVRDGCIDITKLEKIEKKVAEKMRNKHKQNRSHLVPNPLSMPHPAVRSSPPKSQDSLSKGLNMQSPPNGKRIQTSPPKEWNPADTLLQRIQEKMAYIEYHNVLDSKDMGLLKITIDLIVKFHGIYQKNSKFFVSTAHELEATLDLVFEGKCLNAGERQKWQDFQNKWYIKIVTLANEETGMGDQNGNCVEAMDYS